MQIEFGARVRSSDDHDVGSVDRLILDPETGNLKSIAIRQGRFFHHDIEVPVSSLTTDDSGALRLNVTADQAKTFPEFIESFYTAKSDGLSPGHINPAAESVASDPYYGSGISNLAASNIEATAEWGVFLTEENLHNAVIRDGSDVRDREGHKLGEIHELSFDSAARRLTHFTLRRGARHHEAVSVPASVIAAIDDGKVTLSVDVAWIDGWGKTAVGQQVRTPEGDVFGQVAEVGPDSVIVTGSDGRRYRIPATALADWEDDAVALGVSRADADAFAEPA